MKIWRYGDMKINRCQEWGASRVPIITIQGGDREDGAGELTSGTMNARKEWTKDMMTKIEAGSLKRVKLDLEEMSHVGPLNPKAVKRRKMMRKEEEENILNVIEVPDLEIIEVIEVLEDRTATTTAEDEQQQIVEIVVETPPQQQQTAEMIQQHEPDILQNPEADIQRTKDQETLPDLARPTSISIPPAKVLKAPTREQQQQQKTSSRKQDPGKRRLSCSKASALQRSLTQWMLDTSQRPRSSSDVTLPGPNNSSSGKIRCAAKDQPMLDQETLTLRTTNTPMVANTIPGHATSTTTTRGPQGLAHDAPKVDLHSSKAKQMMTFPKERDSSSTEGKEEEYEKCKWKCFRGGEGRGEGGGGEGGGGAGGIGGVGGGEGCTAEAGHSARTEDFADIPVVGGGEGGEGGGIGEEGRAVTEGEGATRGGGEGRESEDYGERGKVPKDSDGFS